MLPILSVQEVLVLLSVSFELFWKEMVVFEVQRVPSSSVDFEFAVDASCTAYVLEPFQPANHLFNSTITGDAIFVRVKVWIVLDFMIVFIQALL